MERLPYVHIYYLLGSDSGSIALDESCYIQFRSFKESHYERLYDFACTVFDYKEPIDIVAANKRYRISPDKIICVKYSGATKEEELYTTLTV